MNSRTQSAIDTEADQVNNTHEAIPLTPNAVDAETRRVADTQETAPTTPNLASVETLHVTETHEVVTLNKTSPGNSPGELDEGGGPLNETYPGSLPDDPHVCELVNFARKSIQISNRWRNETSYKYFVCLPSPF